MRFRALLSGVHKLDVAIVSIPNRELDAFPRELALLVAEEHEFQSLIGS